MRLKDLLVIILMCSPLSAIAQKTIGEIPVPAGYTRVKCDGYGNFLRKIKLTGDRTVHTFDGQIINYQNAYAVPQGQYPDFWWGSTVSLGTALMTAENDADIQAALDAYTNSLSG